jgi:hypothetical protein
MVGGGLSMGGRKGNRKGERGHNWLIHFVYEYENRTMNSVENVLRRGKEIEGE